MCACTLHLTPVFTSGSLSLSDHVCVCVCVCVFVYRALWVLSGVGVGNWEKRVMGLQQSVLAPGL